MQRRSFLKKSAAAVSSLYVGQARGTNDRVNLALMGLRGRGRSLASEFAALQDVDISYLCDVDPNVVRPAVTTVVEKKGNTPKVVGDFREILDDQSVDALIVAAPDHWHALATIMACQAGKDVYVEKPVSHNIREGRLMVKAAQKYNRVIQVGTQLRSWKSVQTGVEYARSGRLGKILMGKVWNNQRRDNIGRLPDSETPFGINYDLWLGPARKRPFNPNRFHYNWHWFWDYGTGDVGNDGVHSLDIARWAMGLGSPTSVKASGGIHFFDDARETPDTQTVVYEYPGQTLIYEMRLWCPYTINGAQNGVALYGTEGYMIYGRRQGWQVYGRKNEPGPDLSATNTPGAHYRNFVDCIRSRAGTNASIQVGHMSAILAHLGNIALRVGRDLKFDPQTESLVGDEEAGRYLRREYREPWMVRDEV